MIRLIARQLHGRNEPKEISQIEIMPLTWFFSVETGDGNLTCTVSLGSLHRTWSLIWGDADLRRRVPTTRGSP